MWNSWSEPIIYFVAKAPVIAVVGSASMDLTCYADVLPQPGQTLYGNLFTKYKPIIGVIPNKHSIIQKYKFSLVIENSSDYCSEKLFDAIINLESCSNNHFLEEEDLLYIQQNGTRLWGIPLYHLSEFGFKKSNGFYDLSQLAQEGNELGIKEDLFSLFMDTKNKEAVIVFETFGIYELRDIVSWLITNESTSSFWEYIGVPKDQLPVAFLKEKGILLA